MATTTKWYEFNQSNPGGWFDPNMPLNIVIEAPDPDTANAKAVELGVYFDGVQSGTDCSCCGNRWRRVSEYDGSDTLAEATEYLSDYGEGRAAPNLFISYPYE